MAEKKGPGRPTKFSTALAARICLRLAEGESLRSICRDDGMPARSTVNLWIIDDVQGFSAQYARARDAGLDMMADEVLDLADDGSNDWTERENKDGSTCTVLNGEAVARSRLRFDARRWYLSKLAPKRYGDKLQHTGADGEGPLTVQIVRYSADDTPAE